jgi:hypothetical protein
MFQLTAHHNCKFRNEKEDNKKCIRGSKVKVLLAIFIKISISVRHTSLVFVITFSAKKRVSNASLYFHLRR